MSRDLLRKVGATRTDPLGREGRSRVPLYCPFRIAQRRVVLERLRIFKTNLRREGKSGRSSVGRKAEGAADVSLRGSYLRLTHGFLFLPHAANG